MIASQVRKFQTLLEKKINQQGHTQLEIEEALGWKNVTIAQLLTGNEELGVRQVLAILDAISVDPKVFFAELYGLGTGELSVEIDELRALVDSVTNLLVENGVVTAADLVSAVAAQVNSLR